MIKRLLLLVFFHNLTYSLHAEKRVLFIGNSYTAVNNLPQLLRDAALSTGDSLYVESYTPGGYTFQVHSTDQNTLTKIAAGNWDYVVLQEQSQRPSFPISQVEVEVYPYAALLDSLIRTASPCAETVFYMTWGRKLGDANNCSFWPPVCTYEGMDSLLRLRYMAMGDDNDAIVSPAGAVWNYIRRTYPLIELYSSDNSHPSMAGSYAAACAFYAVVLRKDPTAITYTAGLSATEANNIRTAAKAVAFDSLSTWYVGEYDPLSSFSYNIVGNQVQFTNTSANATAYLWNFGDGSTDTAFQPTHVYQNSGNFNVTLTVSACGQSSISDTTIRIQQVSVNDPEPEKLLLYPIPAFDQLNIKSDQIISDCLLIDYTGRVVRTFEAAKKHLIIDISSLASGVYTIRCDISGKTIMRKISISN